ncbi:unnamed protein product [Phytophthora fragariaefolia]|uniref:Unnamed protein product n=1 Tax=Phytophthora fragariaefolia TaxID=1490495 RepID=A0A9W6XRY2_9STRA|nr:unnamed protein product [Phytophthora fragariaefolia]
MMNFTQAEFGVLFAAVEGDLFAVWNIGRGRMSKTTAKDVMFMALVILKHFETWDMHAVDFGLNDPDTGSGQWSLSVRNLTLSEGLARVRGAATPHQGAAAAQEEPANSRKRSASQSPSRKARDSFRGLFDSSSDEEEEEGAVPEPQEISNDLDRQQEHYHAAQLQSSNLPSAQAPVPVQSTETAGGKAYPRGFYPPEEGTGAASKLEKLQDPRGLRGYGAYAKVTIPRREAKTPRTTYVAAVASGPRSKQPSGCLPGAGPPAPTSSVTPGIRATSQGAGASHERAAPGELAPHGSGGLRSGLEEPEEASYDYEPPTTAGGSRSPSSTVDPTVALQPEEMRLFRDRLYAIEIALALGPGGQAGTQSGKQGALESLRVEVQSLHHAIRDLHDRADRRGAVGEVSTGLPPSI